MADQVFAIEFDSEAFVRQVNQAITATEKLETSTNTLEASMADLSKKTSAVNFAKPIAEVNSLNQAMKQFTTESGKLDLGKVNKAIDEFSANIPELENLLKGLKEELSKMSESDEGFKELSTAVNTVEGGLKKLKSSTTGTSKEFVPLKTRLRETKIEMQKLEEAGEDNTDTYRQLQIEAAQLTDQLGDQAEAVRALASDTFALDATVGTIKQVASGFQLVAGAQALFGGESEDTQKTLERLLAVMSVVNGLQELQAFLTGQSAARLALQTVWTNALAVSQRLLAISTTTASTAMKGLAAAIAATGIGAIVVAVGLLVNALIEFASNAEEAENEATKFDNALQRINDTADESIDILNKRKDVALANAEAEGQSEEDLFKIKQKFNNDELALLKTKYDESYKLAIESIDNELLTAEKKEEINNNYLNAEKEYLDKSASNTAFSITEKAKLRKKETDLEEEYLKKLRDLRNKALTEQEKEGGLTDAEIKARYNREFQVEKAEIEKQYKDLGDEKVNKLVAQLKRVYDIQSSSEIQKSKEARQKAQQAIVDDLEKSTREIEAERVRVTAEGLDRSLSEINTAQTEQYANIENNLNQFKEKINDSLTQGFITPEFAAEQIAKAEENAQIAISNVDRTTNENRLQAFRDALDARLEELKTFGQRSQDELTLQSSEATLEEAKRYASGEITYEEYQENILKLQDKYGKLRLEKEIANLENELSTLETALVGESDEKIKAGLQARVTETKNAITQAQTDLATFGAKIPEKLTFQESILSQLFGFDPDNPEDVEKLKATEKAINATIGAIVNLTKAQTASEIALIDKAIAKQKEKVESAKQLAEEGNTEYLKLEEERLRKLEIQREAAAKRQLQLDAAIQASQILVAVAGAAAQIAKGGTVNVLTGLASVIAAIGAGANLVRQVQQAQPRLYEGTDYVSRGKNPVGRDTIPAMLNEGEAVISTDTNKKYAPTIKAIRRGLIPEGAVNGFVKNYTNGLRYDKVESAVNNRKNSNDFNEMNQRLARLESAMMSTTSVLKDLNVNVNMDKEGFSASINTYLNRRNKAYRA